jgi:hypothetical protein
MATNYCHSAQVEELAANTESGHWQLRGTYWI